MNAYTCREPGCGQTADDNRKRVRHEDRAHPTSTHRVWRCPWEECKACKYDDASLVGHMARAHSMSLQTIEQLMPQIVSTRALLLDVLMVEAEALNAPAPLISLSPDVVYKQLRELLDDWDATRENLTAAEAEIETLVEASRRATAELDHAREELASARMIIEGYRQALSHIHDVSNVELETVG